MNCLEYGPVICTKGPHKGKIGYLDDEEMYAKETNLELYILVTRHFVHHSIWFQLHIYQIKLPCTKSFKEKKRCNNKYLTKRMKRRKYICFWNQNL